MDDTSATLAQEINSRQAVLGVMGLGYVGLPLAVAFGKAGFRVIGVDIDLIVDTRNALRCSPNGHARVVRL
jgi:UDP-N-acetyl-D-mannosaminuronate dehydrogenase